jgi:hypothetical protein
MLAQVTEELDVATEGGLVCDSYTFERARIHVCTVLRQHIQHLRVRWCNSNDGEESVGHVACADGTVSDGDDIDDW